MTTVKKTENGVGYLWGLLKEKARTITRVALFKIPHTNSHAEDLRLKIGRYNKASFTPETPEVSNPKSELTLDNEEFLKLIEFLSDNFEPFKKGVRKYIPLDEEFNEKNVDHLRAIFDNPDKQRVLDYVITNNILPEDLILALQCQTRIASVSEFEKMLEEDLVEQRWQKWFEKNEWVLGSDFVQILDDREIDTENIPDYLTRAYDGFLDIIEIKRPGGGLKFWADSQDHGNYVPSSDLTKAITQATKYIYAVELEANSVKFAERIGNIKTIKPRCTLIFGRSLEWDNGLLQGWE